MRNWVSAPICAALVLALCGTASAATFNVDSTTDLPDQSTSDGVCKTAKLDCSLRAAIMQANNTSDPTENVINLPAGTYKLTRTGTGEDASSTGDLDITRGVILKGAGARTTFIDGNKIDGVFDLSARGGMTTISGVTIENGLRPGPVSGGPTGAGGINNLAAETTLNDVAVVNNSTTDTNALGGGIYNAPSQTLTPVGLRLNRVLIAGNTSATPGGGIYNEGQIVIQNSTFANNTSTFTSTATQGGGAIENATDANGELTVDSTTFSGNVSQGTRGSDINQGSGPQPVLTGTILADQHACNEVLTSAGSNIENGATCGVDLPNTDPLLGALQNNGGPTDTFLPALTSPAVDTRTTAGCPAVDQRGVGRPLSTRCDIGAVEFDQFPSPPPPPPPPSSTPSSITLTGGGTLMPGQDAVIDVQSKTSTGSPSTQLLSYTVTGTHPSKGDVLPGVSGVGSVTYKGVHDGDDVVNVWWDANGNGAIDSGEPNASTAIHWVLPTPVIAKTVNLDPVSGSVLVKLPKGKGSSRVSAAASGFIPLSEAKNVPIGTIVDATRGRVELGSAVKKGSNLTQSGQFYAGMFQMGQAANSPYMTVTLNAPLACPKPGKGKVGAAAKKKRSRSLWGSDKGGKFRTRGSHSAATVRGTTWFTKDTCTTTTTVVREGTVVVSDLVKHKNVTVKAGHKYVARARKR